MIFVRLYNARGRPVRVEELGFASDQSAMPRYSHWRSDDPPYPMEIGIPKTFGESDSLRLHTWPEQVVHAFDGAHRAHWVWAKLAHGGPLWVRLPPDVERSIEAATAKLAALRATLEPEQPVPE